MSSFRKLLMREAAFNAFNNKFDADLLQKEIDKAIEGGADLKEVSPGLVSPFFNRIYSEFYNQAKQILAEQVLTRDEFEQLLLANVNRETLLIQADMKKALIDQVTSNGEFILGEISNFKIKSESMKSEVYAIDGIENSVDAINLLFSYIQFKERNQTEEDMDEDNALQHLYVLSMLGNQVMALKNIYDAIIWRNCYVELDTQKDTYTVRHNDRELRQMFAIGKFRIEQSTSHNLMSFMSMLANNKKLAGLMKLSFNGQRKPRSIARATVEDGYITYQLKQGHSQDLIKIDAKLHASIVTYYDFIEHVKLPATETLTINDIATLFAEVYELLQKVPAKPLTGDNVMGIDDFYDYPFRISAATLLQFLIAKTNYSIKEVKAFIDILTLKPGDRVNLWKRPFLRQDADLLFALLPITTANTLYIVDEWLTAGGYSLDGRGPVFEQYLKKELHEAMNEKGFRCQIHPQSVLRISDKLKEEIDLIAELSDCLLIAEVKCVSFPTEARDHYNAHKRYAEGASQLNRKIKFLEKHQQEFSKLIPGLASKPIVRAVISNYPLLNGYSIEGVPCVDVNSLIHYIKEGAIDKGLVSENAQGQRDTSRSERVIYYTNEREFCDNLHSHLSNPVSVESLKDLCIWEFNDATGKSFSPSVIVESVRIKQE